jgi:hypothetical protein
LRIDGSGGDVVSRAESMNVSLDFNQRFSEGDNLYQHTLVY